MSSLLIINPVSGGSAAPEYIGDFHVKLSPVFGSIETVLTAGSGSAAEAAERAARHGCENIFVSGGDGTLNEVLRGMARVPNAYASTTIGLLPLGTGNDFAQSLSIPEDVEAALAIITARRTITADLGLMNGLPFVNVSAGGFIAEVSEAVDPGLKSFAGKLAYLIGGAKVLFSFEPVTTSLQTSAGEHSTTRLQMFAVCNARTFGGGRMIAPHAIVDDGLLDICMVEQLSTPEFLALLAQVPDGEHLDDDRVHYFRTASLDMEFERPIKVNLDGEPMEVSRCEYRVKKRAVRFYADPAAIETVQAA